MRIMFIALIAVVSLIVPLGAQDPVSQLDSVAWNYEDAQLTTVGITRFEICFDTQSGASCSNVTPDASRFVPTAEQGGPPPTGYASYKFRLPALTAGAHTVHVKACVAATTCSAPLSLAFTFGVIAPPPTDGRFIRG